MYKINSKVDKPDIGNMSITIDKMMRRGVRLNINKCQNLRDYYLNLMTVLKEDFATKYGVSNPNSSNQLVAYLSSKADEVSLGVKNDILNICYDGETGKWTTNKEAMHKLSDLGYAFAQDLLDYRAAKKYAETLNMLCAFSDESGLVHPRITLGKTNRVNYSDPALMTIPKTLLWDVITSYEDGNTLYSVDIKNQEPSILINLTGAEELYYALESPDGLYETMFKQCFSPTTKATILVDTLPENRVYSIEELRKLGTVSPATYSAIRPNCENMTINGKKIDAIEVVCAGSEKNLRPVLPDTVKVILEDSEVCDVPVTWESCDKKYRKSADYELVGHLGGVDMAVSKAERNEFKTAYLALSYGASKFGIKKICKIIDGSRVYDYITKIEAIKKYRSMITKYSKDGNTCIGTTFGTMLDVGEIDNERAKIRTMLDLPIQGTGADILSLLIKRFETYTQEHGLAEYMSLYFTRHDELVIEVKKEYCDKTSEDEISNILTDMIAYQIDDWIPAKVEVKKLNNNESIDVQRGFASEDED